MAWETAGKSIVTNIYNDVTDLKAYHNVPDQDSLLNTIMSHVIGQKKDIVSVPYVEAKSSIMAFLHTGYYHIHGTSFVYPNHAAGVTLTAGAGAWNLTGNITEVIPANALSVAPFDIHWINISNISANGTLQIDIYSGAPGAEVLIGQTQATRTAVQSQEGSKRIQIPQQVVNTRISCRLSDGTAGALTCFVSFEGHYYSL